MSEIKESGIIELQPIAEKTNERELTFIQRVARLFSVKSLVTLILTLAFAYMSLTAKEISETFKIIYTTIVGFYFGTQAKKE